MPRKRQLEVFVLSGGTGRTGDHVLNVALAQFDQQPKVVRRLNVRSVSAAVKAVHDAAKAGAALFHTVVVPEIREAVIREAETAKVPTVDILGPAIALLGDHLQSTPRRQPGLSHALRQEQFNRIDAVDFTLAHDDGRQMRGLGKANVVLVGVSRVSKSVTCFYLAYRGIRTANVPFVGQKDPPAELLEVDPQKVVGLTMNARRLTILREARAEALGAGAHECYIDLREIARELRHANALMDKYGWHRIDVSYKSVEEVASEIVRIIR